MKIVLKGKLESQSTSEFEGKISFVYQFIKKDKGKLDLINVKSDKDLNFKNDSEVEINISVSNYNNKIYYKAV